MMLPPIMKFDICGQNGIITSPENQGVFQLLKEVTFHCSEISVSGSFTPSQAINCGVQNS
jgi:hypothetical protein